MSYFPHNQEDEYENPRLNRFENNYPVSKSRNYSPENKDRITERIIRYFEDPKESKALAEIKRLSDKAKKQSSKNLRFDFKDLNDDNDDKGDLKNNTELNRVMYKNGENDYQIKEHNIKQPFIRRKYKFATQRYAPKDKNISLMDKMKLRQKEKDENAKQNEKNYLVA